MGAILLCLSPKVLNCNQQDADEAKDKVFSGGGAAVFDGGGGGVCAA